MSVFKDKVLLITGGTGSFGNAVLRRFLDSDIKEIRILSRDEKKQDDMRHFLQANRSDVAHKVKFYIGNVRDRLLCSSSEAGAIMRVLPDGGGTHQCGGNQQCAALCHCARSEERGCTLHRQGSLSYQCHGYLQGDDGEGGNRSGSCPWTECEDHYLLHTLRQCDGKSWLSYTSLGRADDGG